ncbi:MAG: pitrilysin family protein [Candidatus Dojkabacteria bacterium]
MSYMKSAYQTTVFGIISTIGYINDPEGLEGLALVTQEMLSYGCQRLPREQFYIELESLGASLSINASDDSTDLRVRVINEKVKEAKALINELLETPYLTDETLALAKQNVLGQLDEVKSDDLEWAFENFVPALLGQRSSYGTPQSIQKITLLDIKEYIAKFRANAFTLEIKGPSDYELIGFDKVNVFKEVDRKVQLPAHFKVLPKELEQKVVLIGFEYPEMAKLSSYLRAVARGILSPGGLTGFLYEKIRHENSAAYYAAAFEQVLHGAGAHVIYAGVSEKNLKLTLELVRSIIETVTKGEFEQQRIEISKNSLKGSYANVYDNLDYTFGYYVGQLLLKGRIFEYDEILKLIDDVSKEEIVNYFNTLFANKPKYVLVNGQLEDKTNELISSYLNEWK